MKEKKVEKPTEVYEFHASKRSLDLIATSLALVAASVADDEVMVRRMTIQLHDVITEFGGLRAYMTEYVLIIDQLAKLQGLSICPDCGHFHSSKEH